MAPQIRMQHIFLALLLAVATRALSETKWEPLNTKNSPVAELAQFALREYNLNLKKSGQSTLVHQSAVAAWRQLGSSTAYIRLKVWNRNEPELYDAIIEGAFPSMLSFHALESKADSWENVDPTTEQIESMAKFAVNDFNTRLPKLGLRIRDPKVVEAQRKGDRFVLKMSPLAEQRWRLYEATVVAEKGTFLVEKMVPLKAVSGAYLNEDPRDPHIQALANNAVQDFNFKHSESLALDKVISAKMRVPSSFVHYELRLNVIKNGNTLVYHAYFRDNSCSLRSFLPVSYMTTL